MSVLKDIQVGDALAVFCDGVSMRRHRVPVKMVVTRATATQVVAQGPGGDVRFMRRTGDEIGASKWTAAHAVPWTDQHDLRVAESAIVAEQAPVLVDLQRDLDAVMSRVRDLRHRDRPIASATLEAIRESVADLTTMLDAAVKET